jgi:hypothetical protein
MTKTLNTEKQAQIAEHDAKRAERHAYDATKLAGKVRVQILGLTHTTKVRAENLDAISAKANSETEALAKHQAAEALALQKKRKVIEVLNEEKNCKVIALSKMAEAKAAKTTYERDSAKAKAKDAEAQAVKKKAEAKELEIEKRKAESEAKKAKLELEEVTAAKESLEKHVKALAQVEAEMKIARAEFAAREAEAKARKAQANARTAEAKAIKIGDVATAEARRLEAKLHKAEATAKSDEIKELKRAVKRKKIAAPELQPSVNQSPKRQARYVEKKHLSANGLLGAVHEIFQTIPDPKGTQKSQITLCDCLMSGLAVFGLKYPSLLQFDRDSQEGGCIERNLKTLYKVNQAPCDTNMRERLDEVDPAYLRLAFKKLFAQLQRGKELEEYSFLDGYYLMSGDGTGFFSSKTAHCDYCCIKCHRDGSKTYYHQMMSAAIVHPDRATVIPFCPEPITNQDGSEKNDCERNAAERLYRHIRREHPHLPIIVTEDALGSNGPHIHLLKELDMRFILVVKQEGNKSLFEFLKGVQLQEHTHTDDERTYKMRFINDVPLNDSHNDLMVNFIELSVYDKNNNLEYHNSWITDITITTCNAYRLCQGGRAKWKIENETFNTLKNQGYHFEHNFGHGFKHLSTVFAFLMFLAFFIDQIQQSACGLFQAALTKMGSKVRLWGRMKAYFTALFIDSLEQFWQGIAFGIEGGRLIPKIPVNNTS